METHTIPSQIRQVELEALVLDQSVVSAAKDRNSVKDGPDVAVDGVGKVRQVALLARLPVEELHG